jgi:hypothetical protein
MVGGRQAHGVWKIPQVLKILSRQPCRGIEWALPKLQFPLEFSQGLADNLIVCSDTVIFSQP